MPYLEVGKESDPYDLFVFAINAEQTREKYITRMKKFLEVIGIDSERKLSMAERCKKFTDRAKADNRWLVTVIIQFLQFQKDRVNRLIRALVCIKPKEERRERFATFTLLWAIIGLMKSSKLEYYTNDPHRFSFYDDTFRINNSVLGYYHFKYVLVCRGFVSTFRLVRKDHLIFAVVISTLVISSPSISNHDYFERY